jgi:hypothetical protein
MFHQQEEQQQSGYKSRASTTCWRLKTLNAFSLEKENTVNEKGKTAWI